MLASTTNGIGIEADEHELPRHARQHDHRQHDQQRARHELQQAHLDELLQRVDVGRHARHDHAGLLAVVERHRQPLQVVEHADAQVAQEALADPADHDDLEAVEEVRRGRRRRRRRRRRRLSRPASPLLMPSVDAVPSRGTARRGSSAVQSTTIATASRRRRRRYGRSIRGPTAQHLAGRAARRAGPPRRRRPASHISRPPRERRRRRSAASSSASCAARRPPAPRGSGRSWRAARGGCRSATTRPSSISTTRSASAIVAGRWAMTIVVRPRITSVSASRISCSLVGSTAEVASSRISTRGSARIARAMAMRCRWPPESE